MDNLEIACKQVHEYDGVLLRDSDFGEFWHLVGILITPDDLYYEMIRVHDSKRRLYSFVGDIEKSWGFVPVVNGKSAH